MVRAGSLLLCLLLAGCAADSHRGYLATGSDHVLAESRHAQETPLATIARQQEELARLRQEKKALQNELGTLKETCATAQTQVNQLQEQNRAWQQKYETTNQELQVCQKICATQQQNIIQLNIDKVKTEQELYRHKIDMLQRRLPDQSGDAKQSE